VVEEPLVTSLSLLGQLSKQGARVIPRAVWFDRAKNALLPSDPSDVDDVLLLVRLDKAANLRWNGREYSNVLFVSVLPDVHSRRFPAMSLSDVMLSFYS